jgi:hypothetical protein
MSLHDLVNKNLATRNIYACQSCTLRGLECKVCVKAKIEPIGMACDRPSVADSNCFVHTHLSADARPEDGVPAAMLKQAVATCVTSPRSANAGQQLPAAASSGT